MSNRAIYLGAAEELRDNKGQWAAYESCGHCVVLAGPGSGKTKTLTIKLARMLEEDVSEPRGLACITYNNECARELETRLELLGVEPGPRVFIGTVHSFSLTQVILPYAKVAGLGLPRDFAVATRRDRQIALEKAFSKVIGGPGNPQDWDFRMSNYRRLILNRKSEGWQQDPQLASLAEVYEQELRALGKIDFDDMPLLALRALRENEWLRKALLAKFPILAVDEYQDLGRALHAMVMSLCFKTGIRLFAVGDVDQSIYGFIGAHPELLKRLADREDVETIGLRLNYRCGSRIVTASGYALGEEIDYETPEGTEDGTIFFHPGIGPYEQQARVLFERIIPGIEVRCPELEPGDIAILYPAAWIGNYVAEAAIEFDYSYIRTDGNALYPRSSRIMRWLELCAQWCSGGWRYADPRFTRISGEGKRLFFEALSSDDDFLEFQSLLIGLLWKHRDGSHNLARWLKLLNESMIEPLIAKCRSLDDEHDMLLVFIERSTEGDCQRMRLDEFAGQVEGRDSLKLSTLHSSKGREFSVVILFGMDEGRIPFANVNTQKLIESRRLFYVGFTRAEKELHLMYSGNNPSRFVTQVQGRLELES